MAMTATHVQGGGAVDYTPSSAVAAGDVVVQSNLVGVAVRPIAANEQGAIAVAGVFDFPKATGSSTGIAVGTKVYWDAADKQAKADSESDANAYLGKVVKTAADADATVRVLLEQ